jgi:hypothetical protein
MNRVLVTLGAAGLAFLVATAASAMALTVTQTTDGSVLGPALGGGGGLTIDSASITSGADGQFGTFANFSTLPVILGNGVVLSTGFAQNTTAASHSVFNLPSNNMGAGGTAEFDAYGSGHITNFSNSNDAAALIVNFTLSSSSQVGFDFIFGSVEYPVFAGTFTDSFLAFLDGTAVTNQVVFDDSGQAVQVGTTFTSALTTADTNSAFSDPHGLVKLQTFTNTLSAGSHSIVFEVADVNDHFLDSAAFISNLHAGPGPLGTTSDVSNVPEPGSWGMFGIGLACLIAAGRHKRAA